MTVARFHRIRNRVVGTVDRVFAEPVEIKFLKNGAKDPDRENETIEAPLRVGSEETGNLTGGRAQAWRSQIAANEAILRISRDTYAGPLPKKGDKVRAIARAGQPWFEVLSVNDRNHSRIVVRLGEA